MMILYKLVATHLANRYNSALNQVLRPTYFTINANLLAHPCFSVLELRSQTHLLFNSSPGICFVFTRYISLNREKPIYIPQLRKTHGYITLNLSQMDMYSRAGGSFVFFKNYNEEYYLDFEVDIN